MMPAQPRLLLVLSMLLLLLGEPCGARQAKTTTLQQLPPAARNLIAVKVTGTKRFTEAEVVASSGLHLGSAVTEDDFKKAARRLGDTGAFTDIGFTFSFSSAGTKLQLNLTDAPKFVPAHFEDFVWFSDEELQRQIKERVPLFNGELPVTGHMSDEVSDVLQAMLVLKGIPGHVSYLRYTRGEGPVESINYNAANVSILVRNIEFTGAAPGELTLLEAAGKRLTERGYSGARLATFVERQLLPIYRARGYLKASFGPSQPKVIKLPTASSDDESRNLTLVDVTLAVSPGQQYKLSRVEWSGNREFSTDQLQSMIRVQTGRLANTVQLSDHLAEIRTLYGSRGYISTSIKVEAEFDEATGTVVLHLDVKEGAVYHMGELELRGLDNSLTAKLRAAWKLRAGEVYDATYLEQFFAAANKLLPANFDWEVTPHVTGNIRDKSVDVDLQYSVKAPR